MATKTKAKSKRAKKSTPKNKSESLKGKLTWLPKKTFELEFTIPWKKVSLTYSKVLSEIAKKAEIKGFRKGKAPIKLVEKSLDKQTLYRQVLEKLLPETYQEEVKKHNLRPILSPKVTPLSSDENKDWTFKAQSCEMPEVKLGNYEKEIRGVGAKAKIWTPDKGKEDLSNQKKNYDERLKLVTKTLMKEVKTEISNLIIEDEVNRMLSRLLDQVNKLGMTIDQYLTSKGSSIQKLREEYQEQADKTLKMEFTLQAIVNARQIKVESKEIEMMIQATPDKKIQEKLNTPMQKAYIAAILAKRKALDYLMSL